MKKFNMNVLLMALPFVLGCSTVSATTPTKSWGQSMNKKQEKVETFSQLDSASSAVRPKWLRVTPKAVDGYYFVGMSSHRTEKRDAKNESFNDALIGFARFCGLNVQYLAEHRDKSLGGNGGLIDTWTEGNTIAKMQAEMHLGNVTTEDRYTEKYSTFYGGSFMGNTYVDASLVFVPTEEMELCKEHTSQAKTFIAEKSEEVDTLTAKNETLQSENNLLKRQNSNLANVAINQAKNSVEFFKQAGYENKKKGRIVVKNRVVTNSKPIASNTIPKVVNKRSVFNSSLNSTKTVSNKTVSKNIGTNVASVLTKPKKSNNAFQKISIGKIKTEEYATWKSGGEDFMIKLFDVDFGVRRYDYFAFKLERGHNNKNDIILGNKKNYCDRPPCWDASLPGISKTNESGYPFNKNTFRGMSREDQIVLSLLANNLHNITAEAVTLPMYRSNHHNVARVLRTVGYKLTGTEQSEWTNQAARMERSY